MRRGILHIQAPGWSSPWMLKSTSVSHPQCAALAMEKGVDCKRQWRGGGVVQRGGLLMGFVTQNSWGTPMKDWDRWEASVWINWRMRPLVQVIQPIRSEQEPGRAPEKTWIKQGTRVSSVSQALWECALGRGAVEMTQWRVAEKSSLFFF